MGVLKKIWAKSVMVVLSLAASLWAVAYLVYRRVKLGSGYVHAQSRIVLPPPATHPDLGTHHYMHLKGRGVKLHYVASGDSGRPLVLLVHGLHDCWYAWRHVITALNQQYWVVAVSLRGYGDSDKPSRTCDYTLQEYVDDIREFITALGKDKCSYVGHDGGAVVGWLLADQSPHLLHRFIACNGPHPNAYAHHLFDTPSRLFNAWYVFLKQVPYLPELYLAFNDLEELCNFYFDGRISNFSEDYIEVYKYYFSQKGALFPVVNFYRNLEVVENPPLQKITVPTLIMWGTENSVLGKDLAKMSAAICEDVQLKYVYGGDHHLWQKEPTHCLALLQEYFSITQ